MQWVRLLHKHLEALSWGQDLGQFQAELLTLKARAETQTLASQQALRALPALPQFSSPIEHARLALKEQRASLALDVLASVT